MSIFDAVVGTGYDKAKLFAAQCDAMSQKPYEVCSQCGEEHEGECKQDDVTRVRTITVCMPVN